MKRGKPLKRSGWLRRLTPLKQFNRKRRARLYAKQFGEHAETIRELPCCVCGARPSDPAHVRSRGAGGTAKDLVPLCRWHHRECHDQGITTFESRHNVDLRSIAEKLWEGK